VECRGEYVMLIEKERGVVELRNGGLCDKGKWA